MSFHPQITSGLERFTRESRQSAFAGERIQPEYSDPTALCNAESGGKSPREAAALMLAVTLMVSSPGLTGRSGNHRTVDTGLPGQAGQ
jgi:hypothetical protein